MHFNSAIFSVVLGASLGLGNPAPDVTAPAILPRQSSLNYALSTCSADSSVALGFEYCASVVADIADSSGCDVATAVSDFLATCTCQSAANILQCASSFCNGNNWNVYTNHYSTSLTHCFSANISPTPFVYTGPNAGAGSVPSSNGPMASSTGGSPGAQTTSSAGGGGGGGGGGAANSASASASTSKNAGAGAGSQGGVFAFSGFLTGTLLAGVVAFVGMVLL